MLIALRWILEFVIALICPACILLGALALGDLWGLDDPAQLLLVSAILFWMIQRSDLHKGKGRARDRDVRHERSVPALVVQPAIESKTGVLLLRRPLSIPGRPQRMMGKRYRLRRIAVAAVDRT